ncbi:hypothetical protein GQ44DRAFT_601623 [Phaeosphaeriaceae sp. PMI808]|nr:hypothetical protein GQ44DRAFT_601623 [Phaeosphaeriaceae sp. PMI808]
MAGTRRRSRAGDTANTYRPQRSVSHATPLVEETTEAAEITNPEKVTESAQNQNASSRSNTPFNRSTKAFCCKCGSNLGEFYNLWHKVTGSYYVPALLASYSSLLKNSGKQKAASRGTAIEGCTIQPLSCPAPSCADVIGFAVIAGKAEFRGRDFFKLSRIELRCEVSSNETIVVEPLEDTPPGFLKVENLDNLSPARPENPTPPVLDVTEAMEIDSRPPPTQHPVPHHERHQLHQPLQQMDSNRQSLPPPSTIRSPTTLAPLHSVLSKAPGNPLPSLSPAVRPVHETSYSAQPSPRESSIGLTSRRDFPPVASRLHSPGDVHNINGNIYPRPPGEVSLDAIERLQTQISQNSGALAAHTRDIRRGEESFQQLEATLRREFAAQVQHQSIDIQRVDEAVARLHLEMQGMRQALEGISHEFTINRAEMQQRAVTTPSGTAPVVPDAAIEMMAQQVAVMSHKTAELDNLKITIEIMKKKIHHLEQGTLSVPIPQLKPHGLQSSQSSVPPPAHTPVTFHTPVAVTLPNPPAQTSSNPKAYLEPPSSSAMVEATHRPEPTPSQSKGWASINAGTKRAHTNGVNSPQEGVVHEPGSPKRQKVADHVHSSYASSPRFEHRDLETSGPVVHATPSTLPIQHTAPESNLTPQAQHIPYTPYGTQDGPSDENWRSESQRIIEHRPRGRPRGGPGSRGGRVRKSLPVQPHQLGTPEWERDEWQGMSESQAGSDGYYNHVARSGRGIARRGSGGGGRGGYAQTDRAASLGPQGISPGFGVGSPNDPYAHTKKTRTKPIRNADGVLIRKDGRPDMRSQSSAANLRKVHARKDGEHSTQGSPTGFTPTNLHYATSVDVPDTPSPSNYAHPDQDGPDSVQRKHSAIMGKMFPKGVDESRKEHDYAHQVFEEDRGHTAHPRSQYRHHNAQARNSIADIKGEQFDKREYTESQSPIEGDVDIDRTEEQDVTDGEEQTPGQQTEQYHDAHTEVPPEAQPTHSAEESVVLETRTVDPQSSSTLTPGPLLASQVN